MGWFTDLIKDVPVSAVVKERLALAEDRFRKIEEENKELKQQITKLSQENQTLKAAQPELYEKPTIRWGCYQFANETGLYCTACYDTNRKKHLTTRLNSMSRQCPVCKAILRG